jgi:hypothetical protein
MERDNLAAELDALEPGDCLRISLDQFMALFGATDHGPDDETMRRAIAFAEEHGCRLLYHKFLPREPEFLKTCC